MLLDYSVSQDPKLICGPFQVENEQNAASGNGRYCQQIFARPRLPQKKSDTGESIPTV